MRATPLLNNFTSGEWSPLLRGRSDLEQYWHSAELLQNLIVLPYGGITKIPGTHYVSEVKDSSKKVRLIPFEFNVTQAYVLEFGNQYIRFYMDHGQIQNGGSAYEIASTYLEAELPYIHHVQEADVLFLAHTNHPPKKLSRTAHNNWTLAAYTPMKGPLLPPNADDTSTITPSADTGSSISLTATNDIFYSGHICDFVWRIKNGYVKITAVADTKHATADVMYGGDLGTGPGATDDWAEAAWGYRGYPASVTLYEQRLCFAGTSYKPQTVWMSESGEYDSMELGTDDSSALIYTLASANVIRWIFGDLMLFVGTSGGVFNISSGDSSIPMTPTNVVVRRHTNFGCNHMSPIKMGNYLYYVQRDNRKLREYAYEYSKDSYLSVDTTILAEHILQGGIVDLAYQQSPYNLLYCARGDGQIAIYTRNLIQQVSGWSRFVGSGVTESLCSISLATGGNEVWVVTQRTINSQTKRYIEYIEQFEFDDQEDAFFVECGLSYSGTPISTITGLSHLEGEEVAILGDGAVFPNETVVSGEVTIESACSDIQVGLPYIVEGVLPKLEFGSAWGTAQGKIQRIHKISVLFYESLGCSVGTEDKRDVIPFRSTNMEMDQPPDLYTGEKSIPFPKGYGKDIRVSIYQDQPLPLTILSLVAFGETYES